MLTEPLASEEAPPAGHLKKAALGPWGVVFLVISAAAPLSTLAGIAPLAVLIGGVGAPLIYAIAGFSLAIFAVGFLFMARNLRVMGGFYTYIAVGLGKVIGLAAGFLAWLSYNLVQIGLWGLFGVMAQGMLTAILGVTVPWWLLAVAGVVLVMALASLGVDVGAKVLGVFLVLETLLLLVLAVAILTQRSGQLELDTFAPENIFTPNMFAILGFGFAAFMGFESTVLYRNETRDPARSIPRATYIAVAFLATFYAVMLWLVIEAFGGAEVQGVIAQDPAAFFFRAMEQFVGPEGVMVMFVLLVSSIFAGQLGFHNAINRYSFALSRDSILPAFFAQTNRQGSPWLASATQSAVALVVVAAFGLAELDPLRQLVILVNSPGVYGLIFLQLLASGAVLVFILRNRHLERKWYVLPAVIVSLVSMIALLGIMVVTIDNLTSAGPYINTVILLFVPAVMILGTVYAVALRRRRPHIFALIGGTEGEVK